MKILRIFLIILVVIILAVAGISAYVAVNARAILVTQLEKNLGIKIEIEDLRVALPKTIIAEGVVISDSLKVRRLEVTPSLIGLLKGDVGFNSIVIEGPQVTVTRNADNSFDYGLPVIKAKPSVQAPKIDQKAPEKASASAPEPQKKAPDIYISKLLVRNASVTFIDKALVDQPPFVIKCFPVGLEVSRISLAQPSRMQATGQGSILSGDGSQVGRVIISGWVDPARLDMDARLEVQDGKLAYFRPYYKKYVKNELESGDANITVLARSKSNDMTADCHIEVTGVAFKKAQDTEQRVVRDFGDVADMAFDSLLGSEGKTAFDFSIRTKMSEPKFENIKFKGNFFKGRVEAVLSKPPQETIKDFKKIGEEFEAIGKQFKDIFKSK
ncbi:MAG TPA: hypothetical protein DCL35_06140 [Candidatus Omnitrophica bacterium]|nr:hypothetical protein [Candidatus Omnitrophota bacterium]